MMNTRNRWLKVLGALTVLVAATGCGVVVNPFESST